MKILVKKHRKFRTRLRPGGLLLIRPPTLRRLGWSPRTDVLLYEWAGDRVTVYKKPTQTEWRIERLRARLNPNRNQSFPGYSPRTLASFLALKSSRRQPGWIIDVATRHVTPSGGNVYEDLGFPPVAARDLLTESKRRIDDALSRSNASCN